MAYQKTNWTSTTPINTSNLNKIEQGIYDVDGKLNINHIDNKEKETNEYLNGKKIYKKMLSFTTTISRDTILSIPIGVNNAELIWLESSYIYNNNIDVNNGRLCYPIPFNIAPNETSTYIGARINGTNVELLSNGGWNTLWTKVITVKYTKTTD